MMRCVDNERIIFEEYFSDLSLILKEKYLNYDNGIFLEVGANEGIRQSNTFLFEKTLNWTGILIEPSYWFKRLSKNRPNSLHFNCALVSYDWNLPTIKGSFGSDEYESMNMTSKTEESLYFDNNIKFLIEVSASTIDSVISSTPFTQFDLISIDCEGSEYSILKGFNFDKHTTKYFLIEIFNDNYENFNCILHLLREKGYEIEDKLSVNDYLFKNTKI